MSVISKPKHKHSTSKLFSRIFLIESKSLRFAPEIISAKAECFYLLQKLKELSQNVFNYYSIQILSVMPLVCLSVILFVCLLVCLSFCQSVVCSHLSVTVTPTRLICCFPVCMFTCRLDCLSFCHAACLPVCHPVRLCFYPSVFLSVCHLDP
jgi:hypothetical protein